MHTVITRDLHIRSYSMYNSPFHARWTIAYKSRLNLQETFRAHYVTIFGCKCMEIFSSAGRAQIMIGQAQWEQQRCEGNICTEQATEN